MKGFSHFSPDEKCDTTCALLVGTAHGRRRFNGVPMVLEDEEEEEESDLDEAEEVEEVALAVEHVECSGRWWATVGPDGAAVLLVARCG